VELPGNEKKHKIIHDKTKGLHAMCVYQAPSFCSMTTSCRIAVLPVTLAQWKVSVAISSFRK